LLDKFFKTCDNYNMKKLSEKFIKKSFRHVLVKREGDVAIYKRRHIENTGRWHYEVVVITSHDGTYINENLIEASEIYPSTSQWGLMGWTHTTIEEAEKRFLLTLKRVQTSEENKIAKAEKASKKQSK